MKCEQTNTCPQNTCRLNLKLGWFRLPSSSSKHILQVSLVPPLRRASLRYVIAPILFDVLSSLSSKPPRSRISSHPSHHHLSNQNSQLIGSFDLAKIVTYSPQNASCRLIQLLPIPRLASIQHRNQARIMASISKRL